MSDARNFQPRAGMGRFLEAMIGALVVLVALVASALGQTAPQPAGQTSSADSTAVPVQAPIQRVSHPARKPFRAARLTYLTGSVIIEQANSKTPDAAVLNMPLVEGITLSTGDDGQAEVEFEDGSTIRITPNSGISLLNLSVDGEGNYQTRIEVLGGLVYSELRAGTKYQYNLDAGGDAVTPAENSTIRVNLDEPPAQIAVLQGSVHVASVNGTSTVDAQAGQTAQADTAQQGGPFLVKEEIAPETWDQWNDDRDYLAAGEAGTQTAARDQYAGDQGYGWSDLDANGNWYNLPGQGEVWQPDVAEDSGADASGQDAGQGFDPYGYGSWVWTPVGYSWASAYGWGWLPYRCGQWVYFDGFGWGWQPSLACGAYGFGGNGFGGYGFAINISRAPAFWRHPKRPFPAPGPIHPIIHGRSGPVPVAIARNYGEGREVRIKTLGGESIEPLARIAETSSFRDSAMGSVLRRDYPVNAGTHEAALGITATHSVPSTAINIRPAPVGRSNMMPVSPGYRQQGGQTTRSAPASRPQSAPAPRPSSPPAASHAAPAVSSSSSPHK